MLKRILVGIAGTPALPAKISASVDLAQRHGAEISAVSVVDVDRLSAVGPVPIGAAKYAQNLREQRIARSHKLDELALEKLETACAEAGVPMRALRAEGDPLEVLTSNWRYQDLCILGVRGWFDYGVLPDAQNALLKLIAKGVRPIFAVTEGMKPVRAAVIAYNGSPESAKAMKQFAQMSLWPGIEVEIVCVGPPKSEEPAETILQEAVDYCRLHGLKPSVTRMDGEVGDALLEVATRRDAGVIVLGSSFRKIMMYQRFGKNALQLIKTSPVPLFLSH